MDSTNKQLERIYSSSEALLDDCDEQSSSIVAELREPARLYFITRYFVAVFESRHGELPIQVWNEYRNALDHFFRYLKTADSNIGESDDESKNIHKMKGHLQRACLDVLKLFCHRTDEQLDALLNRYKPEVLALVDNNSFYPRVITSRIEAHKNFEKSKVFDLQLGENARHNADVLTSYLNAAFSYDEVIYNCLIKEEEIAAAQLNYKGIAAEAANFSENHELKIHKKFYIRWTLTWGVGLFVIGVLADPFVSLAKNWVKGIFGF